MSTVRKCDRCGEVYETEPFFAKIRKRKIISYSEYEVIDRFITALRSWFGDPSALSVKEYDLCPSCQGKLLRFLEGDGGSDER